jgi:hypothetical protein
MSDFDLYVLKKYLFIPLLVLCIPILWGPALQCMLLPTQGACCYPHKEHAATHTRSMLLPTQGACCYQQKEHTVTHSRSMLLPTQGACCYPHKVHAAAAKEHAATSNWSMLLPPRSMPKLIQSRLPHPWGHVLITIELCASPWDMLLLKRRLLLPKKECCTPKLNKACCY